MMDAEELFYAGGHLRTLIRENKHFFLEWLEKGKSLKFVLQNPTNTGLLHLRMPCVSYDGEQYMAAINESIRILKELKSETNGDIEVRLTDVASAQSIAILDGHLGGRDMCVLFHLPEGEGNTGPFVMLNRDENNHWFKTFYTRFYARLWEGSTKVV